MTCGIVVCHISFKLKYRPTHRCTNNTCMKELCPSTNNSMFIISVILYAIIVYRSEVRDLEKSPHAQVER
jgi:hypothetical protein